MKSEKQPVPLWVWGILAAILIFQYFSDQVFDDPDAAMLVPVAMFVAWAVLYARKRRGL